jgi:hypothetical protein
LIEHQETAMKVLIGSIMIAALGLGVSAQRQAQQAKVLAEVASGTQAVKGQPFSADSVSESVQTLADGNRIVQSSTGKIYRNSEGRIRREMTGGNGGANTFFFNYGPGISIAEPAGGRRVLLDQKERTAQAVTVLPEGEVKVLTRAGTGEGTGVGVRFGTMTNTLHVMTNGSEQPLTDEQKKAIESLKGHKEGDPLTPEQQKAMELLKLHSITLARTGSVLAATAAPMARGFATPGGENWFIGGPGDSKWETKTEDLGTQNIEGVTCEGTRHITTIPAGAIGNDRPIEIVYERWYSKDLGMVVSSKHSDPRFGEQTYTLKNIVRAEPDPSLFTVPKEFKFTTTPDGVTRVRTPDGEREMVRAKAAAAAAPKQP